MNILEEIIKNNLGPFLAILGSTVLSIRLFLAILKILFPNYSFVLNILIVVFNFFHICVVLLIIRRNIKIITKNIKNKEIK